MYLISTTNRTATRRLKQNCSACGLPIIKGDRYCSSVWKYDNIYTLYEHVECTAALLPGVADPNEEYPNRYLLHYFDTFYDTTKDWQEWYNERTVLLKEQERSLATSDKMCEDEPCQLDFLRKERKRLIKKLDEVRNLSLLCLEWCDKNPEQNKDLLELLRQICFKSS
jgi:hypothetical protein